MNELKCGRFEGNSGLSPEALCFILAGKKPDKLLAVLELPRLAGYIKGRKMPCYKYSTGAVTGSIAALASGC